MPYQNDILGIVKSLTISLTGVAAIQLPEWFIEVGQVLNGFESFYKLIIAILTIILLSIQIANLSKPKK